MKIRAFLVCVLFVCLLAPSADAQPNGTIEFTGMQGVERTTPYVNHDRFKNASVNGVITLGMLTTAESVDQITSALGEPDSLNENGSLEQEAKDYYVTLYYDGAKVEYIRRGEDHHGISSIDLTSSSWYLDLGDERFQPGMPLDSLSESLRTHAELEKPFNLTEDRHIGSILVGKPGIDVSGQDDILHRGHVSISLTVNVDDRVVESIRYSRVF